MLCFWSVFLCVQQSSFSFSNIERVHPCPSHTSSFLATQGQTVHVGAPRIKLSCKPTARMQGQDPRRTTTILCRLPEGGLLQQPISFSMRRSQHNNISNNCKTIRRSMLLWLRPINNEANAMRGKAVTPRAWPVHPSEVVTRRIESQAATLTWDCGRRTDYEGCPKMFQDTPKIAPISDIWTCVPCLAPI